MKILILCTGNSCRSQMAHGYLQFFDSEIIVASAGTEPAGKLNPLAVEVMEETGIDISDHTSDHVDRYINEEWDFVVTVCDDANEKCPVFNGKVKKRLHIGFDDPSNAVGDDDFVKSEFMRVREEIRRGFLDFYSKEVLPLL